MLAPVCGVLGTVIGVVLGLVVTALTSTYDAYADGVRSGCVAAGACATRDSEPLTLFIALSYLLPTAIGAVFILLAAIECMCGHAKAQ